MGRPHYNLAAWKKAMELVKGVYAATQSFPADENFGLTAQLRRAAVSIPSNIAEGAARTGRKEFARFLAVAKGSLSELDTQLLIAVELGYLDREDGIFAMADEVSRLLSGLHRKVSAKASPRPKGQDPVS